MQLICAFVFAYAKSRFSHEAYSIDIEKRKELIAYWVIFHAFLSSADFFQNKLFEKIFQKYHQNVKQFGP